MYIIPANTKKSMLILGFFTVLDLIIFVSGVGLTLLLLITIKVSRLGFMILQLLPALVALLLVTPVPYYHNIMQLLRNFFNFFGKRRRYLWKGWCWHDDDAVKSN